MLQSNVLRPMAIWFLQHKCAVVVWIMTKMRTAQIVLSKEGNLLGSKIVKVIHACSIICV